MKKLRHDLFVGCYGSPQDSTIHWLEFDKTDGRLYEVATFSGIENPSFLTIDRNNGFLYAISEVEHGQVISFKIDFADKELQEISRLPTKGSPCYVELGKANDFLFTANYGGGSVIVHKLNQSGMIVEEMDIISYQEPNQQRLSHLHTIRNIPGTNYFVATDLGLDKLYFYQFVKESGALRQIQELILPKGTGPRHLAFHPYLKKIYVVTELQSTILAISYNHPLSTIRIEQEISMLPKDYHGKSYGAEIQLAQSGHYLYASNRGHHSIAIFHVNQDGCLQFLSCTQTIGEWPRHFTISPQGKFLILANEHSNSLHVMNIQSSGKLQSINEGVLSINRPVCVCFA